MLCFACLFFQLRCLISHVHVDVSLKEFPNDKSVLKFLNHESFFQILEKSLYSFCLFLRDHVGSFLRLQYIVLCSLFPYTQSSFSVVWSPESFLPNLINVPQLSELNSKQEEHNWSENVLLIRHTWDLKVKAEVQAINNSVRCVIHTGHGDCLITVNLHVPRDKPPNATTRFSADSQKALLRPLTKDGIIFNVQEQRFVSLHAIIPTLDKWITFCSFCRLLSPNR